MFKNGELRLLGKFYLFAFLGIFFELSSIMWIAYFSYKGFSFKEISIAFVILYASIFF